MRANVHYAKSRFNYLFFRAMRIGYYQTLLCKKYNIPMSPMVHFWKSWTKKGLPVMFFDLQSMLGVVQGKLVIRFKGGIFDLMKFPIYLGKRAIFISEGDKSRRFLINPSLAICFNYEKITLIDLNAFRLVELRNEFNLLFRMLLQDLKIDGTASLQENEHAILKQLLRSKIIIEGWAQ